MLFELEQGSRVYDDQMPAAKTLIAVLSDHGESLGDYGEHTPGVFRYNLLCGSRSPYRASARSCFQAFLRIASLADYRDVYPQGA